MFSIMPAKVAQREGNAVRQLSEAEKTHEFGISYVALLECDARRATHGGLASERLDGV